MDAKDQHRIKLLEYLENPDNEWLNRTQLATDVLGIAQNTLYIHFTGEELTELEQEALASRRKRYTRQLSEVDKAVLAKAKSGNINHIREAYDRFQGPISHKHEVTGAGGGPIKQEITSFPPEPDSLAAWEQMVRSLSRPRPEGDE